jgi:hypothetical protein
LSQTPVASNPSYLGGWDQENQGSRPALPNCSWNSISKITTSKWTGGVSQATECPANKHEVLSSNASTSAKKKILNLEIGQENQGHLIIRTQNIICVTFFQFSHIQYTITTILGAEEKCQLFTKKECLGIRAQPSLWNSGWEIVHLKRITFCLASSLLIYLVIFYLGETGFRLKPSCLQSRHFTAWATPFWL